MEVLANEYGVDYNKEHGITDTKKEVAVDNDGDHDPSRVMGGYKATISNPSEYRCITTEPIY